jgi:hypothetical protein
VSLTDPVPGNVVSQQKRYQIILPYATPLIHKQHDEFKVIFGTREESWIEDLLDSDRKHDPTKDVPKGRALIAVCRINRSKDGKTDSRVMVVGSSKIAVNQYIDLRNNKEMVRDMVNWLLRKERFSITRNFRRVTLTLSKTARDVIFYVSIFVMPLVFLGIAMLAWWERR